MLHRVRIGLCCCAIMRRAVYLVITANGHLEMAVKCDVTIKSVPTEAEKVRRLFA
jgi:hypothetical protein